MKKQMLLAAFAGLTLVSAHPPANDGPEPMEARSGYPPCSRTVTDRCIQLYERGVRTATNLASNATPAAAPKVDEDEDIDVAYAGDTLHAPPAGHHSAHHAAQGPAPHHPPAHAGHAPAAHAAMAARHYPACGAGVTDRCSQHRAHRQHPPRRQLAMRVRRAGERG